MYQNIMIVLSYHVSGIMSHMVYSSIGYAFDDLCGKNLAF